ncbi:hypothetical protein HYC85_026639 [Camellia sinensis]|uniref:EamA domain-containing protein n=1 Tax=Camellia sinensis TaxID=4442 RepID=A0A7J7G461_CAMSI|nr:hypothetical protein HYC85_026639 [Camellia sinensis]
MGFDLPSYKVNDGALNFLGKTTFAIRQELVVSGRPFFLGSGDNESKSLLMSSCQARGRRPPAFGGRSGFRRTACLDFATSKAKSSRRRSFSAIMFSNLCPFCFAYSMIACIASCSGVEGEVKFRAHLTGMVSGPSMFGRVRSSFRVVLSVTIEGSSVTPAMDMLEYSHKRRQLWRSVGGAGISTLTDNNLCGDEMHSITMNQVLYLVGLHNSTPTIACALTNLLLALTFILAVPFGLESVGIKRKAGQAKIFWDSGVVCVGGAMLLSLYHGRTVNRGIKHSLEAKMSEKYAAPYTTLTLVCLMAIVQCGIFDFCADHNISAWSLTPGIRAFSSIYGGIVCTAAAFYLMSWCIQRKGPLYVSVFNPLLLIIVAILSWCLLEEKIYVGTCVFVVGSCLIVMGLYAVLWGKNKEMNAKNNAEDRGEEKQEVVKSDMEI